MENDSGSNDLSGILRPERRQRRHLIDILQDIQAAEGYISLQAMLEVSKFLDMPGELGVGSGDFL